MIRAALLLALAACVTTRAPSAQEGQCGAPPRPVRGNNVYGDHGTAPALRANPSR
jgi:hypothetical protein